MNKEYSLDLVISGGEASRISIAQNIFTDPDVIMIDEALSSLDDGIESTIIENLFDNFTRKTFVCISHRKSTEKYFNKIIDFDANCVKVTV